MKRELCSDAPRRRYVPTLENAIVERAYMKGLHFGQRKLLLSEIEFLTMYSTPTPARSMLVVYAGAANGSHLPFLFNLFPGVQWILIDPAPFCDAVHDCWKSTSNAKDSEPEDGSEPPAKRKRVEKKGPILELRNVYCTAELCKELAAKYSPEYCIYLISDIRCGDPRLLPNKDVTSLINQDNSLQASFCYSLNCEAAMLKFHPPYPPCTNRQSSLFDASDNTPPAVQYFKGRLFWGVWAPKSSTEVRLLVNGPFTEGDMKADQHTYDLVEFEEQLYYYNTNCRFQADVAAEQSILQLFLARKCVGGIDTIDAVQLSNQISIALGHSDFQPLNPQFTEDDARLYSALQLTTRFEKLWPVLKTKVPIEAVLQGDQNVAPEFWKVMSKKILAECYSIVKK